MRSSNKVKTSRKIKPVLTPSFGTRLYISESGSILFLLAAIIYMSLYYYMSAVETTDGGSIYSVLGDIGAMLMVAGALISIVTSKSKFIPGAFNLFGIGGIIAAIVIFFISNIIEMFTQQSSLGVLQIISSLIFMGCCAAALLCLIMSIMGVKVPPAVGALPAYIGLIALLLLLVRTMTSFGSLKTALGGSFDWETVITEQPAEVSWVLRGVSHTSPTADRMFYARFFERIGAILLMASSLPAWFRFTPFFKDYNINMQLSTDIHKVNRAAHPEQYEDEQDDEDGGFVDINGLSPLGRRSDGGSFFGSKSRRRSVESFSDDDDHDASEQQSEQINEEAEENSFPPPYVEEPREDTTQKDGIALMRKPVKIPDRFNSHKRGERKESAQGDTVSDNGSKIRRNSETGAIKVKLRPVSRKPLRLPDPDDMSIWNNYKD